MSRLENHRDTLYAYRHFLTGSAITMMATIVMPLVVIVVHFATEVDIGVVVYVNFVSILMGASALVMRFKSRWVYISPRYSMDIAAPITPPQLEMLARHQAFIEPMEFVSHSNEREHGFRIYHINRLDHVESKMISTPVFGSAIARQKQSHTTRLLRWLGMMPEFNRFPATELLQSK